MTGEARDPESIERRLSALRAVRQVVHALWALSSAELPLVEQAVAEAGVYYEWLDQLLEQLLGPPLQREPGEVLHVVIGPERGYTGRLCRDVLAALPPSGPLGLVGRRWAELGSERADVRERALFRLPGALSPDEPEAAQAVATAVLEHARGRQVELHFPRLAQRALSRVVLIAGARSARATAPDTYSPLPRVIAAALEEALRGRITLALAEVLRAEVAARLIATERAHRVADQRVGELEQQLRVALGERVTSELAELVASRAALAR